MELISGIPHRRASSPTPASSAHCRSTSAPQPQPSQGPYQPYRDLVKLSSPSILPFPYRSSATVEHPVAVFCSFTDDPFPALPHPIQTPPQVRLDLLSLPDHSTIVAGDQRRRNPANPPRSSPTLGQGPNCKPQFLSRVHFTKSFFPLLFLFD